MSCAAPSNRNVFIFAINQYRTSLGISKRFDKSSNLLGNYMKKSIIIERSADSRVRVAVTQKGSLIEYDESSESTYRRAKNAIYNATIKSIRPELGAAFVQYTPDNGENIKDGFLPFSNIASVYLSSGSKEASESDIAKQIKVGQKILVQIKKDQLHHESKGAALTTFISLAGTYLVLLPLNQKQGISRKADSNQRDSIKETLKRLNVDESMGLIIRTAGLSANHTDIEWDYKALMQQWQMIEAAHKSQAAPCLIHEDENIVTRMIRDNMSGAIDKISCNDQETLDEVKNYLETVRPSYIEDDVLTLFDHDMMFHHYSLEEQVEQIFHVRVSLPSGGQVVFHGTEAGYMIDVNSSKSTVGTNVEENALNTNREAAVTIADMLRLRDISGIIHIDFIDMYDEANRTIVEKAFSDRASLDRAKIRTEPISLLTGCMSLLRQGLGTVFFKSSLEPIENDEMLIIGKRRSVPSYSNYVLSVIEKSAAQTTDIIQVQLPVEVATYILNELRSSLHQMETHHQVIIKIIPNEHFTYQRYVLKRFHREAGAVIEPSHTLMTSQGNEKAWIPTGKVDKPHVQRKRVSSQHHKGKKASVLGSIWQTFFGSDEASGNTASSSHARTERHNKSSRGRGPQRPRRHNDQRNRQDGGNRRRPDNRRSTGPNRAEHTQKSDSNIPVQPVGDKNFNSVDHNHDGQSTISVGNTSEAPRRRNSGNRTRRPRSVNQAPRRPVGHLDDD
jgi:ribonuclease E